MNGGFPLFTFSEEFHFVTSSYIMNKDVYEPLNENLYGNEIEFVKLSQKRAQDDFENLYKGEISKSGTPILPSKRARKTPEKIQVTKEDLAELSETATAEVDNSLGEETMNEQGEVSLDEVSESENQEADVSSDDTEASNS